MRKICLSLTVCLVFHQIICQEQQQQSIDSLLKPLIGVLDQHIVLYDRVTPLANLSNFNSQLNTGSPLLFEQAISELFRAANQQQLVDHKTLRNFYSPDSLQSHTDIGLINATFQELNLKRNASDDGAFQVIDTLLVSRNNGQDTFRQKHVFMATATKRYIVGPIVTFVFDPNLLIQTPQGKQLVRLWSDLGGQLPVLIYDDGLLIQNQWQQNFSVAGDYTIHFTAEFSDGSEQTTKATIHVKIPDISPDSLIENGSIWAQIPWQGFNESTPLFGKLDYRIFYRTRNNHSRTLKKPIVIIDGFDPGDRRQIQDSDPHPWSSDADHRSIEDMMSYTNNQGEKNSNHSDAALFGL